MNRKDVVNRTQYGEVEFTFKGGCPSFEWMMKRCETRKGAGCGFYVVEKTAGDAKELSFF